MKTPVTKYNHSAEVKRYISNYNPYVEARPFGVDIAAMSRFAASKNCTPAQLSGEDVKRFLVKTEK